MKTILKEMLLLNITLLIAGILGAAIALLFVKFPIISLLILGEVLIYTIVVKLPPKE